MDISEAVLFGTALLALINPPSLLPAYTEIVAPYSQGEQRQIAVRTTVALVAFMWVVLWSGQFLLNLMDIQVGALQAAGGVILLRVGFRQADANDREVPPDELARTERESWKVMAVVPLAIPLTAGGGTIALIVATAARHNEFLSILTLSLVCLLVSLIIGVVYFFATSIRDLLGPIVMRILVRIGGIILIAISVQLLAAGLIELLPGLAGMT